jgi:hypothetical protein
MAIGEAGVLSYELDVGVAHTGLDIFALGYKLAHN